MKHSTIKIAIATSLLAASTTSYAGLDDQMRDAFGTLVNTTQPASFETARRGGISGGSLFIKSPTKRTNLMSATAPSFSAGCGGIDLYGGSMSFISADEFIATFQAIGANAVGYGVKLALQSACPTCEQIMTSLEKTAQFINNMNIDSCQAAQGIVNAGVDFAATGQADVSAKTFGVNSGQWQDLNEAWGWTRESGQSPTKALESTNPTAVADNITINTTWKALKESNVASVYGGDNKFLELIMTMIGTVIVRNPDTADTETDPKLIPYQGRGITLKNLMDGTDSSGNKLRVYDCDTETENGCLKLPDNPTKEITITGLSERVNDSLVGANGLVQTYASDSDWSTEAKEVLNFPTLIGQLCVQKIRETAINGTVETHGQYIANICADRMALEIAYVQVTGYIQAAKGALNSLYVTPSQETAKEKALEMLEESRKRYLDEFRKFDSTASVTDIITQINQVDLSNQNGETITGK